MSNKYGNKKASTPEELLRNALDSAVEGMRISSKLGVYSKADSDRLVNALKEVLLKYKGATVESAKVLNDFASSSSTLKNNPKVEKALREIFEQAREASGLKAKEDKKHAKILNDIHKSAKDFNDSTSKNLEALNDKMGVRGYLERKDKPMGRFLEIYQQIKKRDGKQGFSPISLIKAFGSMFSNSKIFKFLGFSLGWFGRWPALIGYKIGSIFEDYKKHNADVWDTQKEYYKKLLEEGNKRKDIEKKMQSLPGALDKENFGKMASEAYAEYIADANNIFRIIASDLALAKYKTKDGQAKIIERAEEAGVTSLEILNAIKSESKYMSELKDLLKNKISTDGQNFEVEEKQSDSSGETTTTKGSTEEGPISSNSNSYLKMIFEELQMFREDFLHGLDKGEEHNFKVTDRLDSIIGEFKLFREDYLRELNERGNGTKAEKGKGIFGKILEMIPGLGLLGKLFKGGGLVKGLVGLGASAAGVGAALAVTAIAGYKFGQWLDKTYKLGDRFTSLFTAEPESAADTEKRNQRMIELHNKWKEAASKGDKEEMKKINKEKQEVMYGAEIDRSATTAATVRTINILREDREKKAKQEKEILMKNIQQKSSVQEKPVVNVSTQVPSRLDTVPGHVEDIALRTFSEGFLR